MGAWTTLFGLATHLFSELVGLGYQADATLVFSTRHFYLALLASFCFAAILAIPAYHAQSGSRRKIAHFLTALPFAGRGPVFTSALFATQFSVFLITQFAEGCPLQAGDFGLGILAASAASAIGALIITLCNTRLLSAVCELFFLFAARATDEQTSSARRRANVHVRELHRRAHVILQSSLPPPRLLTISYRLT
jgi:hypothetical protein